MGLKTQRNVCLLQNRQCSNCSYQ